MVPLQICGSVHTREPLSRRPLLGLLLEAAKPRVEQKPADGVYFLRELRPAAVRGYWEAGWGQHTPGSRPPPPVHVPCTAPGLNAGSHPAIR